MADSIDIYSDQFQMNFGPYGSTLNFLLSSATPPAPGAPPQAQLLASVRMSLEHLKVMTFLLRKNIIKFESDTGVTIQLPRMLLNSLGISPEDWDSVWK